MSPSLNRKQNYLDHKPSSSKNENVWTMKKNAWSIIQTVFRSQNSNRKKKFDLPQVVINAELYGLALVPRLKKGYHQIWEANLQLFGPMFQYLLIS
jgi:hypothetical protein